MATGNPCTARPTVPRGARHVTRPRRIVHVRALKPPGGLGVDALKVAAGAEREVQSEDGVGVVERAVKQRFDALDAVVEGLALEVQRARCFGFASLVVEQHLEGRQQFGRAPSVVLDDWF